MLTGIAIARPAAVVISATLMPPATSVASTSPASSIAWNASIMPITVPRKPSSGATFDTVASQTSPLSRLAISMTPTFSIAFITRSEPSLRRSRPAPRTRAAGAVELRASVRTESILRCAMSASASFRNFFVRDAFPVRSISFQTMTTRPMRAQAPSGHIIHPPSRHNWAICSLNVRSGDSRPGTWSMNREIALRPAKVTSVVCALRPSSRGNRGIELLANERPILPGACWGVKSASGGSGRASERRFLDARGELPGRLLRKGRDDPRAVGVLQRVLAAWVEGTPWRRSRGAGHVAGQHDPIPPRRWVRHRHGREQSLGVRVARPVDHLPGGSRLHDPAGVPHGHAIARVLGGAQVVCDEQVRGPEPLLQVGKEVEHLCLHGHVERRDRLVADDEIRFDGEGARDADALALAAAELVRVARRMKRAQPDGLEQLVDPPPRLHPACQAVNAQHLPQGIADGKAWIERAVGVLEHDLCAASQA